MHSACCIPASGRDERDILDHAKVLVCTFSQPLQMLSLKALCKCMHEGLTQALTRTAAGFAKIRLIFRASFKYKLCDTNSSDLSMWSSFAPLICICTTAPNGLPALAFADSKRPHCKWIQNARRTLRKKPIKWVSGKLGHRERRNRVRHNTQRVPLTLVWLHDLILSVLD